MAGALEERQRQRLEALGVRLLEPELALAALGDLIQRGASGAIGVLDVDWLRLARQAGERLGAPLQRLAVQQQALAKASGETAAGPPPYVAVLADTPAAERPRLLQGFVQQQLAKVMGVSDPDQIDPGEPLFNLGLDSLMALELMVLLEKNLGITLTESLVFEHPTVDDLVRYFLRDVLFPEDAAADHTTSGVSEGPKQASKSRGPATPPGDSGSNTDSASPSALGSWDQQVADVAAMDTADLLKQLRGE